MLDLQPGEYRSLPQCLNRSPKLPVGVHRTGPCLVSQSVEGGAGLNDVVEGGIEGLCDMDISLKGELLSQCGSTLN